MNHDFDNENDNEMDDDDAEEVPRAPKAPKNGTTKPKKASANKESERKKRELITMGKAKGFLTYDEVNEHMPENIVSSDQMDDWLSAFSGEGIEIVDSSSKLKVGQKSEGEAEAEEEEEEEVEAKKEEPEEEEDADGYSKTNDPVRMYLRKMGSVSLLTREGEVEIAKRIEDGERKMLQAVLNSSVAVEELLRYESPSQHTARIARDDVVIGGKQIRKGQAVIAVMAAGNRDPERFADPDRLDLERPDNRHLAFGWASHFCFGAPLARLEAEISFRSILTRLPDLHLTDAPLVWRENLGLRGLTSLPLTLTAP
jgi:hypothetical protein